MVDYKCKNMIDRINLILQAKNITAKQFAEEIGIQPSGMSHILGGRNNPSLEFVTKVLRRYPEIDANWLLSGRGAMYRGDSLGPHPTVRTGDDESSLAPAPSFFEAEREEEMPASVPEYDTDVLEDRELVSRRLTRLLLIYSDGTFEECIPQC